MTNKAEKTKWKPCTTLAERRKAFWAGNAEGIDMCATCDHFIQHYTRTSLKTVEPMEEGHCTARRRMTMKNELCISVCERYVPRNPERPPVIANHYQIHLEPDTTNMEKAKEWFREHGTQNAKRHAEKMVKSKIVSICEFREDGGYHDEH